DLRLPQRLGRWSIPTPLPIQGLARLHLLPGPDWERLSMPARNRLCKEPFRVESRSDRMGLRLRGSPLELTEAWEASSEPVAFGTLQLPPDGQPILLLADAQTTGGYPRIAQLAGIDRSLAAQLRPGDEVRF